jgi:hypothetical protein
MVVEMEIPLELLVGAGGARYKVTRERSARKSPSYSRLLSYE